MGTQFPEIEAMAARRLGIASMVYAVAYLADYSINRLTAPEPRGFDVNTLAALVSIPLALLVFVLARSGRVSPRRLVDIGAVWAVAASFGMVLPEHWEPWPVEGTLQGVSWLCVWIAFFPVVVPSPLGRSFATTLASATTAPLALALAVGLRGNPVPGPGVLVDLFEPVYLTALLAPVSAAVVYRLGRLVSEVSKLGSYELVERLGQGGMGEVWRAQHAMLKRPAAIKLIRADTLAKELESAQERFEREARATAALTSPHTIRIYDFGVSRAGEFYYVMELLHGQDLESMVAKHGPMPVDRAVHLLEQLCHSLSDAHWSGLIHRDIKPANVYVCVRGAELDVLKILDFGLAKAVHPSPELDTRLADLNLDAGPVHDSIIVGTPAYLAPEAVLTPERVDHRADLYGLGCVAYWMVTGHRVFEAQSPTEVILRHVNERPPPPSERSELPIPEAFDALVLACLAKDPAKRPQDAEEVRRRLAACGVAQWSADRARQWWDVHEPEHRRSSAPHSLGSRSRQAR